MNKYSKFLEKSISVFIVLIGILAFTILIQVLSRHSISYYSTELLHLKVLAVLAVLGGVLLFFEKKPGWIISAAISFSLLIICSFSIQTLIVNGFDAITISAVSAVVLAILLCGIILLSKPFTTKYKANLISTLVIVLIVSYFFIDRIIAFKSSVSMIEIS